MPNSSRRRVRKPRTSDARVMHSTAAAGYAALTLLIERDFRVVTVQDILDRSGVSRTTFYAHFRNKQDALYSAIDRNLEVLDSLLANRSPLGTRIFPVAEFLDHATASRTFVAALRRAGEMADFRALCVGHIAQLIERRLDTLRLASTIARPVLARMLAGAVIEILDWWEDHGASMRSVDIDVAFHALARGVLRSPGSSR